MQEQLHYSQLQVHTLEASLHTPQLLDNTTQYHALPYYPPPLQNCTVRNVNRAPQIEERTPRMEDRTPRIEDRTLQLEYCAQQLENRTPKLEYRTPQLEFHAPQVQYPILIKKIYIYNIK